MRRRAEPVFGWLRRPGIGRRIALAMALALFAVQAQAFVQIWLFARAEVHLVGTRWLAETVRDAAQTAFGRPEDERAAALRQRFGGMPATIAWSRAAPWDGPEERPGPEAQRLVATVRALLEPGMDVAFSAQKLEYLFPFRSVRVGVSPPEIAAGLATLPLAPDAPGSMPPWPGSITTSGRVSPWSSGGGSGRAMRLVMRLAESSRACAMKASALVARNCTTSRATPACRTKSARSTSTGRARSITMRDCPAMKSPARKAPIAGSDRPVILCALAATKLRSRSITSRSGPVRTSWRKVVSSERSMTIAKRSGLCPSTGWIARITAGAP